MMVVSIHHVLFLAVDAAGTVGNVLSAFFAELPLQGAETAAYWIGFPAVPTA
jgi:hypothetical protein